MEKQIAPLPNFNGVEKALIEGDLSKLTPDQRLKYYLEVCQSLGLNPLTRPFDYIVLNGKLTLYAKRDATDQLRKNYNVSVQIVARETIGDLYVVTARATMPDGRFDESIGAVAIAGLRGDALANAMMKAETKAKRRVTLSICGMGFLDETEVESIPDARLPEEKSETIDAVGLIEAPQEKAWDETVPLDVAQSLAATDGKRYWELATDDLKKRLAAINDRLKKNALNEDQKADLEMRKQVIEAIIHRRA